MAHYYFDVDTPHAFYRDEIGEDVSDLQQAQQQALWLLTELAKETRPAPGPLAIEVQVREMHGNPLYRAVMHLEDHWST